MAPEIGSLRALANGESQFVGSSSGVYFINTVKRAFLKADGKVANDGQHLDGSSTHDEPSPEDCIVGGEHDADSMAFGRTTGPENDGEPPIQLALSSDHVSPLSEGEGFTGDMSNLPIYSVARDLVLIYFRIWHPLGPFLHGPECLANLDALYSWASNSERKGIPSTSLMVTFRCIFNIARLEKDGPVKMGSTAIRSPSDLLPTLCHLALRCDTASIQALLCAQVYFISTMSLRHASSVSGLIAKSIFQSGMHRCPVRYGHLSPDERSMRKRVFWSFYVLDRFVSQSLGHPSGIQDSDIDVCPPGTIDLHEPVVKSNLSPGSEDTSILHLPCNHPDRRVTSPPGQTQCRGPSPEAEKGTRNLSNATGTQLGDVLGKSAVILQQRKETQAVLEHHVRHSQLVGRILEVFHKSIHARHLDSQTVLFLKADIFAFGNDLTQPRLHPTKPNVPSLTPDPTVFPFISHHYAVLLLNRPSLSLDSRCGEFREALQTCISAANTIVQTISRYVEFGGPLFWPGYMSAVWMSGLVLALAIRLELCNKPKAKSTIYTAIDLLVAMSSRWAMARHCEEVLSTLLKSIDTSAEEHKRPRSDANAVDNATMAKRGDNYSHTSDQQNVTQSPLKRRRMNDYQTGPRNSRQGNLAPMSPQASTLVFTQTGQGPSPVTVQGSQDSVNSRNHASRRDFSTTNEILQHNTNTPQASWIDHPNFNQHRHPATNQFAAPPASNACSKATSGDTVFAPIPITFPDQQRNDLCPYTNQLDGTENLFDMFDGATWGSLLEIVNSAGTVAEQ